MSWSTETPVGPIHLTAVPISFVSAVYVLCRQWKFRNIDR